MVGMVENKDGVRRERNQLEIWKWLKMGAVEMVGEQRLERWGLKEKGQCGSERYRYCKGEKQRSQLRVD